MTDPKSRKVILVEHPLLPLHIKDIIARVLFDNLQVGPGLHAQRLLYNDVRSPRSPSLQAICLAFSRPGV